MKFSANLKKFAQAVRDVSRANEKSEDPVFTSITLTTKRDKVSLFAKGYDTSILTAVEAQCYDENFSVATNTKNLSSVLKSLKPNAKELGEFEMQDNSYPTLKLRARGVEQELQAALPHSETVAGDSDKADVQFSMRASVLRTLIDKVIMAISKDNMRPAMMGALFFADEKQKNLCVVSSDGHRLVKLDIPLGNVSNDGDLKMIIPKKALSILLNMLPKKSNDVVTVKYSKEHTIARVEFGETVLTTTTIEYVFPNYEAVIPSKKGKVFITDVKEMIELLNEAKSNTDKHFVKLKIKSEGNAVGQMTIEAEDADRGLSFSQTLMGVWKEEQPFFIAFNIFYLIELLEKIDSPKVVFSFMEVGSETKPATKPTIIKPFDSNQEYAQLILQMPVRVYE